MLWATEKADENISLVPIGSLNVLSCPCFVLVRRSVQPGKYFTQYPQCNLNLFMTLSYQSFFQVWENQHHCFEFVLGRSVEAGGWWATGKCDGRGNRSPSKNFIVSFFTCYMSISMFCYISKGWWAIGKCGGNRGGRYIDEKLSKADKSVFLK